MNANWKIKLTRSSSNDETPEPPVTQFRPILVAETVLRVARSLSLSQVITAPTLWKSNSLTLTHIHMELELEWDDDRDTLSEVL